MVKENLKYEINSVERVFKIIELMAEHGMETSATDIASELGMPKGTLHRFMKTLESLGYIEQKSSNKKYLLTGKFIDITRKMVLMNGATNDFLPIMKLFVMKFELDVSLLKFSNGRVYNLYSIAHSLYSVNTSHFLPGKLKSIHALAAGKLLLSTFTQIQLDDFFEKYILVPLTPKTIISKEELLSEIIKTRKQGYALAHEEFEAGVASLSVPIKSSLGEIVGAMAFRTSIEKANQVFTPETIKTIMDTVDSVRVRQ